MRARRPRGGVPSTGMSGDSDRSAQFILARHQSSLTSLAGPSFWTYCLQVGQWLLEGDETARGIEAFSRRSVAHGAREWTSQDVRPGAA